MEQSKIDWEPLYKIIPTKDYGSNEIKGRADANEIWENNIYRIVTFPIKVGTGMPNMVELLVKRKDKSLITNWMDLQKIKNEMFGDNCEALGLYPTESRLKEDVKYWYFWVVTEPNYEIGRSFFENLRMEKEERGNDW